MENHPGALEAHHGAVEAYPAAGGGSSWNLDLTRERWSLTLELRMHTQELFYLMLDSWRLSLELILKLVFSS
jgi:hypothetical protein